MKKKIFYLFFILISCLILFKFDVPVKAESIEEESNDEYYTKSDELVVEKNGIKSIFNFADYVNSCEDGEIIKALDYVIPQEHIHNQSDNYTFKYFGKEYGYYGVIDGMYLDLLLINFTLQSYKTDNQYLLQVEPILQKSFYKVYTYGNYFDWKVIQNDNRDKFYISNPRFMMYIENINDYNTYNSNYKVEMDNGSAIVQNRLNYGEISYKTEKDLLESVGSFLLEKNICKLINALPGGEYLDDFLESVKFLSETIEAGTEETIMCDNEKNIYNYPSRSKQIELYNNFIRCITAVPKSEIVLNSNVDSYANCIIMVDEIAEPTRISGLCEFDIIKRKGMYQSFEYVEEKCNYSSYLDSGSKEIKINNDGDFEYYLINNSSMTFLFKPLYSGYYNFASNCDIKVNGNTNYSNYFLSNTNYLISLSSKENCFGIFKVRLYDFENTTLDSSIEDITYKYVPIKTDYYIVSSSNAKIYIYSYNNNLIAEENSKSTIILKENETYYLKFEVKQKGISTKINLKQNDLQELKENINENFVLNSCAYKFANVSSNTNYEFIIENNDLSSFTIEFITLNGERLSYEKTVASTFNLYRLFIKNANKLYLKMTSSSNLNLVCHFNQYETDYIWKFNGSIIRDFDEIVRGQNYKIELYNKDYKIVPNKFLTIGPSYSKAVQLSYIDGCYNLFIPKDAKLYDEVLNTNLYLDLYVYGLNNIKRNLKVCYEKYKLNLEGFAVDVVDAPEMGFLTEFLQKNETAVLNIKYRFDDNAIRNQKITMNKSSEWINLKSLNGFSNEYYKITLSIDTIELYTDSVYNAKLYNVKYDSTYSSKTNRISVNSVTVGVNFESGNGTAKDPFIITNCTQFNHISDTINNGMIKNHFKIGNDFNYWAGSTTYCFDAAFYGVLDGDGHTISSTLNYKLNSGDVALFREISSSGIIKNLNYTGISNCNLANENKYCGSLAISNYGTITNCKVFISENERSNAGAMVGGIVACNYGLIEMCTCSSYIQGGKVIGGIAGYNSGSIIDCTFDGAISYNVKYTENDIISGIVGEMTGGKIYNCAFSGNIYINVKDWENREYAPYVNAINKDYLSFAGSGNCINNGKFYINTLNPSVTWRSWFVKHEHNQRKNVE